MVRNTHIEAVDHVHRPMIALSNVYEDGHRIAPHRHRRGQLLCGASGVVMVTTAQGSWVMPPQRGMWVPGGVEHEVRMLGAVTTRSLYLEQATVPMPDCCQVVGMSPLMQSLMAEAVDLPVDYPPGSRADAMMQLIQHELQRLPVLPLSLPFPTNIQLARQCRRFLAKPTAHATIDEWSQDLGMSRRAFTRLFRRETGISFATWRQQACLVAALPRLVEGEAVTQVAVNLGYENPAAFTTMFKRVLGASPRAYLKLKDD